MPGDLDLLSFSLSLSPYIMFTYYCPKIEALLITTLTDLDISLSLYTSCIFEQIELPANIPDYFLCSNASYINVLLPKNRVFASGKAVAMLSDFDFDHGDDVDLTFVRRDDFIVGVLFGVVCLLCHILVASKLLAL